jgi:GMP synthase (glutamine-hydrolysing)
VRVLCVHHEAPLQGGTYDAVIPGAGHEVVRWAPFSGEAVPELDGVGAVVVFGGEVHPDADGTEPWLAEEVGLIRRVLDERVPLLGLCLGAQLIARASGAWVGRAPVSEVGWYRVELSQDGLADPVLGTLGGPADAFEWHHYTFELPEGAVELARSARAPQAFSLGECTWAVQFHPEVTRELIHEWTSLAPDQVDGDPDDLRAETDRRIGEWSSSGRRLCLAFLDQAALGRVAG